MTRILGTVTIGQSPRLDLIPEMKQVMAAGATGASWDGASGASCGSATGESCRDAAGEPGHPGQVVEVLEAGALDGLTLEEVRKLAPVQGDYVLVTRMADGTAVKIAERHILPLMQEKIDGLVRRGADVVALVCTGEFPQFPIDCWSCRRRSCFTPRRQSWVGSRLASALTSDKAAPPAVVSHR
ncbi:MAG: AroM family protein [Bacillota bacterium]